MLPMSQGYYERMIDRFAAPALVMVLTTSMGQYALGDLAPGDEMLSLVGPKYADGQHLADGSVTGGAGTMTLIESGAWIKTWGTIHERAGSLGNNVIGSITQDRPPDLTVVVKNQGGRFNKIEAQQGLVGSTGEIRIGYLGLHAYEWHKRFVGYCDWAKVGPDTCTLHLKGIGPTAWADEQFTLKRAGEYSSPRDPAAMLPIVYGDMTDSAAGQWRAPCIDTSGYVYAFAGASVLSAAGGNTVKVFDKDGAAISSGWTFNHAHDFGGNDEIATITFTADQESKEPLSVSGMGRADDSDALIELPAMVANDFAINLAGLDSGRLDQFAIQQAAAACQALGYKAAGLIEADGRNGDIMSGMLGNFAGSWWLGNGGLIKMSIDVGAGPNADCRRAASVLPHESIGAVLDVRSDNLINRIPISYAYNWATKEYQQGDDGAGAQNNMSIRRYGLQDKPMELRWVRNATVANAVRSELLSEYSHPARLVTLSIDSLWPAYLEQRDLVSFSSYMIYDDQGLPLTNQFMEIRDLSFDLDQGKTRVTLRDTGDFITVAQLADGGFTAGGSALAGGQRKMEPA